MSKFWYLCTQDNANSISLILGPRHSSLKGQSISQSIRMSSLINLFRIVLPPCLTPTVHRERINEKEITKASFKSKEGRTRALRWFSRTLHSGSGHARSWCRATSRYCSACKDTLHVKTSRIESPNKSSIGRGWGMMGGGCIVHIIVITRWLCTYAIIVITLLPMYDSYNYWWLVLAVI